MRDSAGSCFDNCFVSQFESGGEEESTEDGRVVWEVGLGGFYHRSCSYHVVGGHRGLHDGSYGSLQTSYVVNFH